MNQRSVFEDLRQGLAETPMLDAHTHLTGGRMSARGLHDVLSIIGGSGGPPGGFLATVRKGIAMPYGIAAWVCRSPG